jgi:REP-associated tyrosine transposase
MVGQGFRLPGVAMLEYQRRLPHFQPDHVLVFLTWRLWGSLPYPVMVQRQESNSGRAFALQDRALDRCTNGPLWLGQPRIAALIAQAIQVGEVERQFYELASWVVMPNHVHLLVLPKKPLPVLTRWLTGSTARRANHLLGRTGRPFCQDESYDHCVRNRRELGGIIRYIENNPVSAGLVSSIELWPWSSAAAGQAKPHAPPVLSAISEM